MQKELKEISDYWEKIYSRRVPKYQPFKISNDLKRFASFFALGKSYWYIVNLHNFQVEFISDSVEHFVNKKAVDINLEDLLKTVVPEEIESIRLRSRVISNFYTSFLEKEIVLDYKIIFTYRLKDSGGNIRTMLYQAFPLTVLENGAPEHVICIHTDVSHLKMSSTTAVSFINMNGGKSYFNVNTSKGFFDPEACDDADSQFSDDLTEREKEIVLRLSRGLNAEQIAKELNLSPHTIKTHRRNVLKKSGCTNTTELVAKCLTSGIISPNI